MQVKDGKVPHYVKVQMGALRDAAGDGTVATYIPLDESADGIAVQLAILAREVVEASEQLTGPCPGARVVNVDGTDCSIPVSHENDMATAISRLVAPRGWGNA